MSTLYIVATPIGNLDDLTLRAARILGEVPVVVAEDSRVTRKMLDHIGAKPKVVAFHRRSSRYVVPRVMDDLANGDVALVSDAGTPGINDPGQAVVASAAELGHHVVPLPGSSAIVTALSVSGFYVDQFSSHGFLPAKSGQRRRLLEKIAETPNSAVFFETPHRLRDALVDIAAVMAERNLVICREMTKLHEEIWRGSASEALAHFDSPRGEFVIVIAPLAREKDPAASISDEVLGRIDAVAAALADRYESRRDLVDAVTKKTGLPRRQVYQALHREA